MRLSRSFKGMFRQDIFMYLPRKSSVKRGVNYPVIKKSLKSAI